jgi:hypothetical protein
MQHYDRAIFEQKQCEARDMIFESEAFIAFVYRPGVGLTLMAFAGPDYAHQFFTTARDMIDDRLRAIEEDGA